MKCDTHILILLTLFIVSITIAITAYTTVDFITNNYLVYRK